MRSLMNRRAVAVVATVAMSTAGLIGLASSANAAPTTLKFNCSASIVTNQEFVLEAEVNAPAQAVQGETVKATFDGTVTIPDNVRAAAYSFLGGRSLAGPATVNAKLGSKSFTNSATLPSTPIPSTTGSLTLPVSGSGSVVADTLGAQNLTIDGFTADLAMTKSDGSTSALAVTCTAKAPATVVTTVNVVAPAPDPEPTDQPTVDPEPTDEPTVNPEPTDEPTVKPTTPPETKPNPLQAIITSILALLKKLLGNLFKR